jgi:hypothetical protein
MTRIKKLSPMQELINKMSINETYTKPIKYRYPKVKDQSFPQNGFNYEADILELVQTKDGYNRLLCVVDIQKHQLKY